MSLLQAFFPLEQQTNFFENSIPLQTFTLAFRIFLTRFLFFRLIEHLLVSVYFLNLRNYLGFLGNFLQLLRFQFRTGFLLLDQLKDLLVLFCQVAQFLVKLLCERVRRYRHNKIKLLFKFQNLSKNTQIYFKMIFNFKFYL